MAFLVMTLGTSTFTTLLIVMARLLFSLHVDHAEIKFGYCDSSFFDDSARSPDRRVFTQPILREESIVLLLKSVGLLPVFVGFLQQLEEGALSLIRLLQFRL